MENTLFRDYRISSYDINPAGTARLTAIANFLQETAYHHANNLNVGYHQLRRNNHAWLLSRIRIRLTRYPRWDEYVRIETWPRGLDKLFALRDFRIFDQEKLEIGQASTCWLMVDTASRRPVRLEGGFIDLKTRTDSVFVETPPKISLPEHMEEIYSRTAKYSDIDIVGHVNNVRYIEWCIDAITSDAFAAPGISDLTMNFLGEAHFDQQVKLLASAKAYNEIYMQGHSVENGKECFRARLIL